MLTESVLLTMGVTFFLFFFGPVATSVFVRYLDTGRFSFSLLSWSLVFLFHALGTLQPQYGFGYC